MAEVQIQGEYVVAVVDSVAEVSPVFESRARDILADAGIESPAPDETYPRDAFASALSEMVETAGATTVKRAGEEMVERNDPIASAADFDSGFETLRDQHAAVHTNFDPADVGQYRRERLDDREYRVATRGETGYPEPLVRGAVGGVVSVTESPAMVEFEDTPPEPGEVHAFVVSW